jgi:hypothetical protein
MIRTQVDIVIDHFLQSYARLVMKRNSPTDIGSLDDLSRLGEVIVDKRLGKRATAKKSRRNRHYENQFIRNALTRFPDAIHSTEDETTLSAEELMHSP